ncbi:calcium-binding protein [Methylobacterium sp. Leaf99]|uniref:calcium-binding protein n=1 Tax=Methylobacterium sp. Leaf99 TaxID=1736251 RepID=UPI000A953ED5|nr:calcium-binding protein [Methylobacterium sp. Leaf99]
MAVITGTNGNDLLVGTIEDDKINGLGGNDLYTLNIPFSGSDTVNLGEGSDSVTISPGDSTQVRISFDAGRVGDGIAFVPSNINDKISMFLGTYVPGLPVFVQAENANDIVVGQASRFDDEGISFAFDAPGATFDVRTNFRSSNGEFVESGRIGDQFSGVVLGSQGNDAITVAGLGANYYISSGNGNDTITGGSGNDVVFGGIGEDTYIFDLRGGGSDTVDLGDGSDVVQIVNAPANQIRLTFTSAEVGNGRANDSNAASTQDGGLGVRLQSENGSDGLVGPISRFDDEGTIFTAPTGTTFDVRDLLSGAQRGDQFNVVMLGNGGNDTFTASQPGFSYYMNGGSGFDTMIGGRGNDVLVSGGGADTLDGGGGFDRAIFSVALRTVSYSVASDGSAVITRPDGTATVRGIEEFVFADRTINVADGSPLVDDLYYLIRNPDVAATGIDADTHYFQYGAAEGRDPNAFFSTTGYLAANSDVRISGQNPLSQYDQAGFRQGRDPSASFDNEFYLSRNPDVAAAGLNPLAHYLEYGQAEGRAKSAAIGQATNIKNGFDAEYYLLTYQDVARAAITNGGDSYAFAQQHFEQSGFREGRNPNAVFDTRGYLSTYADVGGNPLTHYDLYGFKEGRDPSKGFDSSAYLNAYADVRVAGVDPMQHYLQYGIYEGRSPFSDNTFGAGNLG